MRGSTVIFLGGVLAAFGAESPAPKPLNNLVTELLNVSRPPPRAGAQWRFTNPRAGWVFFQSTAILGPKGELSVSVERIGAPATQGATNAQNVPLPASAAEVGAAQPGSGAPSHHGQEKSGALLVLTHGATDVDTREAMRFLAAGEYNLNMQSKAPAALHALVVRAIPELIFCKFEYDPHIAAHGPYDWPFLQKHVLPHVNCIVGDGRREHGPLIKAWKEQGKRWLIECGVPSLEGKEPLTAEQAYDYWTQNAGFQDPLPDGVIADEFLPNHPGMKYPEWTEAVRRIHAAPQWRSKFFYAYCTAIYGDKESRAFLETVIGAGYRFAWEQYFPEPPTESQARQYLAGRLAEMPRWRNALPGCEKNMVLCLGYMSMPATETLNINPQVDYKVWMDLQFQHLATDPASAGLYGLMEFTSGHADDETVRWAAKLYRHYGLEGKTNLLSSQYGFKYALDHIQNSDFDQGLSGWVVEAADTNSVAAKTMKGFGWLEGRYPRTPMGDTFLWTKRSGAKPNRVAQPVQHLRPGQLYSLKMVTADYQELQQGKSASQKHAVSMHVIGAEALAQRSFQQVVANNWAHNLGPFNNQNKAWLNYHYQVFRAKGPTAELAISDWASPTQPGGPPGQELMFNFLELQPYFAD